MENRIQIKLVNLNSKSTSQLTETKTNMQVYLYYTVLNQTQRGNKLKTHKNREHENKYKHQKVNTTNNTSRS